jgi:hypothetical protein
MLATEHHATSRQIQVRHFRINLGIDIQPEFWWNLFRCECLSLIPVSRRLDFATDCLNSNHIASADSVALTGFADRGDIRAA